MLPNVYVFDAYGTLFDVHSAVGRHEVEIGADFPRLSEVWRRKQLEYSWIRTLMGRYLDFAELTEQALDYAIKQVVPQHSSLKSQLLAAYRHLEAYQDVRTALSQFKARGAKLAILSNGSPEMLKSVITSNQLSELLDVVLSVDAVRAYKADRAAYAMAVRELGVKKEAICFLSSNRWDVAGAVAFGLRAVWVNRTKQPDEYLDLAPEAEVATLEGLVDSLG